MVQKNYIDLGRTINAINIVTANHKLTNKEWMIVESFPALSPYKGNNVEEYKLYQKGVKIFIQNLKKQIGRDNIPTSDIKNAISYLLKKR